MSDDNKLHEGENGRSWAWPDGPLMLSAYGHECYATYLCQYLPPKVTPCQSTQDELAQEMMLHLLKNYKHFRTHGGMQPHSFIALQARQAIDRFLKDNKHQSLTELGDVAAIITEANKSSNWRA